VAGSPVVRVIGVGNPLRGDDGVGVAVAGRLAGERMPPGVEVVDGGTGGLTLLGLMEGASRVVLVDAADLGRPPGSILRVADADLALGEPGGCAPLHGVGVADALALGAELGTLPPLVLLLVQVGDVEPRMGLSPALAEVLDDLVQRVRDEVNRPEA